MGGAIREAVDMVRQRKDTYRAHGISYYRPWIFLITDGGPTDEWKIAADLVKQGETSKAFSFFAVGVEGANMDVLKQICVRPPLKFERPAVPRPLRLAVRCPSRSVSRSNPGDACPAPQPDGAGRLGLRLDSDDTAYVETALRERARSFP